MTRKVARQVFVLRSIAVFIAGLTVLMGAVPTASAFPLFLPAVNYGPGGITFSADAVAVADVNGDGKPDLLVANSCFTYSGCSIYVGVLLGNGDGTFQPEVTYATGGVQDSPAIAVGDVNGDGKPDLVVTNCAPVGSTCGSARGVLSVLMGNGNGTFQPAVTYDSGGAGADSLGLADVNSDGKLDLLVATCSFSGSSCSNGLVGVLLGNGDGTFHAAVTYNTGEFSAAGVAVADLNSDGKPDLIVTNNYSAFGLGVLLGNGDGTFQPVVNHNFGGVALSLAVADINGDGNIDVVMPSCVAATCSNVSVLLGRGDGTFRPALNYGSGGYDANSVAVADVNGDGKLDLVLANQCLTGKCPKGGVGVLLGNGDGTFKAAVAIGSGGGYATFVAIADVNGDGWPDLLMADDVVSVLMNNNAPNPTGTSLSTSGSPSFVGQSVTFSATVGTFSSGVVPDGETVTFFAGTTRLGTGATAGGVATFSSANLKAGTRVIKATYNGDETFKRSTGTVPQVVNTNATTTTVGSSLNPSHFGQAVTFTARVTVTGPDALTGKVRFFDGTAALGTVALSGGVALLTKSTLIVGTHAITAEYLGDPANAKSTSSVLNQVVQ